jgi:CheY-like chemotaxis protein
MTLRTTQRILVVDDDRDIVRLMRAYLEQAGYNVLTAYEGETALHMLRREHPHLLILDLMLPERDGWEITRIVRGDTSLQDTPIIMLTARIEDTDKIVGLELGADDYVTRVKLWRASALSCGGRKANRAWIVRHCNQVRSYSTRRSIRSRSTDSPST